MEQMGRVLETNDGMASLEVKRISSCGDHCAGCSGVCDVPSEWIEVQNTLNAQVGDYVEIKTDSSRVLKYMALLYGLPLLGLIVGIVVGYSLLESEISIFLMGLGFMLVSALILRIIDSKMKIKASDMSYMARKL